jgi:hypothetical protein
MSIYSTVYNVLKVVSHSPTVQQSPLFTLGVIGLMALPFLGLAEKDQPIESKDVVPAHQNVHPEDNFDIDKQLTAWVTDLQEVTELDLSGCNLTSIPPEIGQLRNLQSLNLSNNQLTTLPDQLGQLEHLEVLDIENNLISEVPSCIAQLPRNCSVFALWNPPVSAKSAQVFQQQLDSMRETSDHIGPTHVNFSVSQELQSREF